MLTVHYYVDLYYRTVLVVTCKVALGEFSVDDLIHCGVEKEACNLSLRRLEFRCFVYSKTDTVNGMCML